ncbi:MAG: hypothetical protein KME31_19810 [Tolypothrix carrinoi HA7290-LM1]|nr:hypothetical protein [Tolypothrix carrinoi HA7290-LM1]
MFQFAYFPLLTPGNFGKLFSTYFQLKRFKNKQQRSPISNPSPEMRSLI